MKGETKSKLDAVLARKQAKDREQAELERSKQEAEIQAKDLKRRSLEKWAATQKLIVNAVGAINEVIQGNGMHFEVHPYNRSDSALASQEIRLLDADDRRKALMLHLGQSGNLQSVFLIPHTGKGETISIFDVDQDYLERLLSDFLDQVITARK
jgi:hypothetical protein